jgi:hypothetical protein
MATKLTTGVKDLEKSEHGGVNVAGRWRNGYKNGGRNGSSDLEHAELRRICKTCDSRIDDLEKFSDELRLGQTLREEQIRSMQKDIERVGTETAAINLQYQADQAARELELGTIRDKIDSFKTDVTERINALRTDTTLALSNAKVEITTESDKGLRGLTDKFDDNKNYFTRYFIIILVTILTGLIVGGAAFILGR